MKEIKTSENVEFDVIYADGSRYHAKEGVLIEAEGDRINLHLGTSRVAVVFAAVEALMEAIGDAGLMDAFKRYIDGEKTNTVKRLTSDDPQGNLETMMNMVVGIDGWQHIRHDGKMIPTTDFCMGMCEKFGCADVKERMDISMEEKDSGLFDCLFVGCEVATVYAALSGCGHLRDRLKRYEDAGIEPPMEENDDAGDHC